MWIFGYGSLIWKVDFPICDSQPGYIKGYVRRFWQSSNDHRGTVESPGRVVTLITYEYWKTLEDEIIVEENNRTYGMAYKIPDDKIEEVKKHLDFREKNGYSVHVVDVYNDNSEEPIIEKAFVYIGTPDNEAFVGPIKNDILAEHIFHSIGPSGTNLEYLLNLCEAYRLKFPNSPIDPHLLDLETRVLKLEKKKITLK